MKTKNSQIIRWLGLLAEYDFDIHHKKAEQMKHVDALSRAPVESAENDLDQAKLYSVTVLGDEILLYQRTDERLSAKIEILEKNACDRTRREKGEIKDYLLKNGMLYKLDHSNGKELFVVPPPC